MTLFFIYALVTALWVARVLLTETLARKNVYHRDSGEFSSLLATARGCQEREDRISFGSSAANEKNYMLDNMLGLVNLLEFASGPRNDPVRKESRERLAFYSNSIAELNREIELTVDYEKDLPRDGTHSSEPLGKRWRWRHLVDSGVLALLLLLLALHLILE